MRNLMVVSACWLAMGGAASASSVDPNGPQVKNEVDVVFASGVTRILGADVTGQIDDLAPTRAALSAGGSTAAYDAEIEILPSHIDYSDGGVATGRFSSETSTTSITIMFRNTTAVAILPKLSSLIVPAGFGFYMANLSACGASLLACPQSDPSETFANLGHNPSAAPGAALAGASFSFDIRSGAHILTSLSGSLSLGLGAGGVPTISDTTGALAGGLTGFRLATPLGSLSALGYAWDATTVNLDLGALLGPLAPGAWESITYDTTVTSFTNQACDLANCVLAYSMFGDPIGRSGNAPTPGDSAFGAPLDAAAITGLNGGTFQDLTLDLPTYQNGQLSLFVPSSAVPEPSVWALMLVGLGIVGGALRRREHAATA